MTPLEMPPNGRFAGLPETSTLVIYIASRPEFDRKPPLTGARYGLYLSRDGGATWELVTERADVGPTQLLSDGGLFAITGYNGSVSGDRRLLRSADLGKTWRDISGDLHLNVLRLHRLEPDPDHAGLVRLHASALRGYIIVADDANYRWKAFVVPDPAAPKPAFFWRAASSTNPTYHYRATLLNYFGYDFGNLTSVDAVEVVPLRTRFEFARGAPVVVPIRVVFHYDPDLAQAEWRKADAEGHHYAKPTPPTQKFADQFDGTAYWGLRVESPDGQQVEKDPLRDYVTTTVTHGKTVTRTIQPPRVAYRVFHLSPSAPYERTLDLGRFHDFSKPGAYRVQTIYRSGRRPDDEKGELHGILTSPVFTVVIRG
jgi:hypothetical protein